MRCSAGHFALGFAGVLPGGSVLPVPLQEQGVEGEGGGVWELLGFFEGGGAVTTSQK